jgi:hypothetical protein
MNKRVLRSFFKKDNSKVPKDKNVFEPPNWKEQWKKIEEMRENKPAPVDTMG